MRTPGNRDAGQAGRADSVEVASKLHDAIGSFPYGTTHPRAAA